MGWERVWRPFKSKPEPEQVAHNVPVEPVVVPAPEPAPVTDVSSRVRQAANTLAQRVWDTSAQPRDHLLSSISLPAAEAYLAYGRRHGVGGRGRRSAHEGCCESTAGRACCGRHVG